MRSCSGPTPCKRRQRAVQHVIDAVVVAGLFDGGDVGRLLDHAHQPLVARRTGAIDAGIDVGDVVADRAEMQAGLHLADGVGEQFGVLVAGAQDVEGEALRASCCPRRAAS